MAVTMFGSLTSWQFLGLIRAPQARHLVTSSLKTLFKSYDHVILETLEPSGSATKPLQTWGFMTMRFRHLAGFSEAVIRKGVIEGCNNFPEL